MSSFVITLDHSLQWAVLITLLLAGGSFLNVVITRVPAAVIAESEHGRSAQPLAGLLWPASHCPHCQHRLRWHDNLPLIGWFLCRGRCRDCRLPIGWRYPATEAILALAGLIIAIKLGLDTRGLSLIALTAWLLSLGMIDLETRLLPDFLTLSGLWLGLLLASLGLHLNATEAILGAIAGYLILAIPNALYRLWRGVDGMGGGDFKLLALIGAWLGPLALPSVLLLASGGGLLQVAISRFTGRFGAGQTIAFGPWLAAAAWITVVWGHEWHIG